MKQDKIECKICNGYFSQITNTHLRLHNYIPEQYKEEFKVDKLVSIFVGNKITESKLEHIVTEETREKLRKANVGKKQSIEMREKQSISHKKLWAKPDYRECMLKNRPILTGENHPMYGKHHSKETRKKNECCWVGQK